MGTAGTACNFLTAGPIGWSADWAWGVPLIVLTVLIHVLCLGLTSKRTARPFQSVVSEQDHPTFMFLVVVGATTLLATSLHAIEAGIWAGAYRLLGALPNYRAAMLYSLSAMTSYGHTDLVLENQWRLMGALESLNGWLLFGLSTAFLFGVIQKVWFSDTKRKHL